MASAFGFGGPASSEEIRQAIVDQLKQRRQQQMQGLFQSQATGDFLGSIGQASSQIGKALGMALGGGWEMAMACDLVIASEEATFGLTEVNLGVLPAGGGTQRLPRLIGKLKAKELLFTGERISASEAEKLGLVNKVVSPEELISEARDIAIKIAEKAPLAIKEIKSVVDRGLESNFDEGLGLEMKAAASLLSTKDAREGMLAFAQKRKPKFQGR